jgi:hypothetical protein
VASITLNLGRRSSGCVVGSVAWTYLVERNSDHSAAPSMAYPSDLRAHRNLRYAADYEPVVPASIPGRCNRSCAVWVVVGGSWRWEAWRIDRGKYSRAAEAAEAL